MDATVSAPMKPTPAAMKAAARRLLKGLSGDLAAATAESSVHGARRQIKRLRSLMRLVREAIGEDQYREANEALKATAGLLAGQRRAEALVVAAVKHAGHSVSAKKLVKLMEDNRDVHAAHASTSGHLDAARASVAALAASVAAWKLPRQGEAIIAEAFIKTYARARKRLAAALKSKDMEELHEARKYVIHHFHHLELLQESFPEKPAKRLAKLEALREILGDLNDIDELEALAAEKGQAVKGDAAKTLHKRRKLLFAAAAKAGKPLFRHGRKDFAKRNGAMWGETGAHAQS